MSELIECGDLVIEIDVAGEGPPLLCCNGTGATIESSKVLLDPLRQVCEVTSFNARGLGRSSAPQGPWTMADYANDCIGVLDALGLAKASIFGISFGGMVALELAVTAPARIERLALWATSAGGSLGSSYPLHELATAPLSTQREMAPLLLDARFTPSWLEEHADDAALVRFREQSGRGLQSAQQRRCAQLQLDARAHHDVSTRLGGVTAPTLVGVGTADLMAPAINGEALVGAMRDATLATYEGGHLFFLQDRRAMPQLCTFVATGVRP